MRKQAWFSDDVRTMVTIEPVNRLNSEPGVRIEAYRSYDGWQSDGCPVIVPRAALVAWFGEEAVKRLEGEVT